MIITLYRRDFKKYVGHSGDFFNDVLDTLKIPERKQTDIEEIEIKVKSFEIIEN